MHWSRLARGIGNGGISKASGTKVLLLGRERFRQDNPGELSHETNTLVHSEAGPYPFSQAKPVL